MLYDLKQRINIVMQVISHTNAYGIFPAVQFLRVFAHSGAWSGSLYTTDVSNQFNLKVEMKAGTMKKENNRDVTDWSKHAKYKQRLL